VSAECSQVHGLHGIHPRVLKEQVDVKVGPLSIIYQRPWGSGEVAVDWKLASVIPIYKKGMKKDPGNYRHVSLTSFTGKIMEKNILGTVESHLKNNAITRHRQHGFTKGKSYLTNLKSFYNKVTCLVDKGNLVDVVFLDICKASHRITKSQNDGLEGTSGDHLVQPTCQSRVTQRRLHRNLSRRILNTSREGESTTPLGNLFQCSVTLEEKKFFLMFKRNFLCFSLCPLPLVLPLGTTEKSLAPSS